jgi:predicted dehydrogenase
MLEGGPLVDCGVHQIDLARWWLGSEVESFDSVGAWVVDYDDPDHIYLHMHHANGALTTVEVSFTFGHTAREPFSVFSYHLVGTGGILRYERDGYVLEAHTGSGTIRLPGSSEKNFAGMHEAFLHALETGDPGDLALPADGIVATRIASQATERARNARRQN